jgi:hypothetical protein
LRHKLFGIPRLSQREVFLSQRSKFAVFGSELVWGRNH